MKYLLYTICALLFTSPLAMWGQTGDDNTELDSEDIIIVKPYEPNLLKGERINVTPKLPSQSEQVLPVFSDYFVPNRFLSLGFEAPKLKPLSYKNPDKEKLYNAWLKAGFGSQVTPLVDFAISSGAQEKFIIGLNGRHISSRGKVDHKDYSNNYYTLYGKVFGEKNYFSYNVDFLRNKYHFYGYDHSDASQVFTEDSITKRYTGVPIHLEYGTLNEGLTELEYKAAFDAHLYRDSWDNREIRLAGDLEMFKNTESGFKYGGRAHMDFTNYKDTTGTGNLIIDIEPSITYRKPRGFVSVGANIILDRGTFYPFPNLYLEANVVEKYLTVYAGWNKEVQKNSFERVSQTNPYLNEFIELDNSRKESRFIGFKGNIGSKFTFDLQGGNYITANQLLFVNDTIQPNKFNLLYDPKLTSWGGEMELGYHINRKTSVYLLTNIMTQKLSSELKAWHLPTVKINLKGNFFPIEKLNLQGDLFYYNGVYAQLADGSPEKIKGTLDLNFSAHYQLLKNLGIFCDVNNVLSRKYERFMNYESYGFNILGGLTLRF